MVFTAEVVFIRIVRIGGQARVLRLFDVIPAKLDADRRSPGTSFVSGIVDL
jgi:hypothetical protein